MQRVYVFVFVLDNSGSLPPTNMAPHNSLQEDIDLPGILPEMPSFCLASQLRTGMALRWFLVLPFKLDLVAGEWSHH